MTQAYSTELTLERYELLASLLPPETETGRPRTVNMMSVIQGILYVLVTSCAWRLIPKEYPPSSTVYYYCLVALSCRFFIRGEPAERAPLQ